MLSLLLALQAVGSPIPPMEIKVTQTRRVGQRLTVDYTVRNTGSAPIRLPRPTVIQDEAGHSLPAVLPSVAKPSDPPADPNAETPGPNVAPGGTVGETLTFELPGRGMDDAIYKMDAPIFNESTWFFVIGGQRIPFSF